MRIRMVALAVSGPVAAALIAARAAAQDSRLERLDAGTRPLVVAIIDLARAAALPTEPLVERALEGVSKGARGPLVVAAVRRLAADLGRARDALAPRPSAAELEAGAAALRAGASQALLAQLRRARGGQGVLVPLAVLTDLVAEGVPMDSAAAAVLALVPIAHDAEMVEFRRAVDRDIALGVPAASAASVRLNAAARAARPGRP
jgi:hypothetical protein